MSKICNLLIGPETPRLPPSAAPALGALPRHPRPLTAPLLIRHDAPPAPQPDRSRPVAPLNRSANGTPLQSPCSGRPGVSRPTSEPSRNPARQRLDRIERGHPQDAEMPKITRQDRISIPLRRGGDRQVREPRRQASAPRPIRQGADATRRFHVNRKHPRAVEVQERSQPFRQPLGLPLRPSLRLVAMPSSTSATVMTER